MVGRRQVLWTAAIASLVLAIGSASAGGGFRRYLTLSQNVEQLRAQNEQLRAQNALMYREVQALGADPQALERAAREELGFIRDGEIIFSLEAP